MKRVLFFISIVSFSVFGQKEAKEQEAFELSQKAIELMDFGKVDQSITLLEKCITLDPTNFNYPYELGYAYKLQRDYQNAILTYKKAVKYKDATDQCYQMLGNVYEASGDLEGALKSYKKGLKKFPKSGKLYYEIGNIQADKNEALKYYEKGINADPSYPTNYYVLAKYFLTQTKVEMWGMIYGELFMNIERGSARTEEIGKLIYDKYKSELKVLAPNSISVSFYNAVIDVNNSSKIPFGMKVYEPLLMLSAIGIDSVSILNMNKVRTGFTQKYFESNYNKEYPNVLFDWQKLLIDSKYFECYNYWLLMKGNDDEFHKWYVSNSKIYDEFIVWFSKNKLLINDQNRFVRFEN